ncbi:MAG: thiamine phosphate synthase [Gemmatimonadetes bacterium]|nr:thiamine phosphate synthase [Gemmatimonadota bacterium]
MPRAEPVPPLHAVTDDAVIARGGFAERAGEVMAAGGADVALHLRAPGASGRRMFALAERLVELARASGSLLVINDRVDVAMAAGAPALQLAARSLSIEDARRIAGDAMRIGVSVHAMDEARDAVAAGAEWLVAGSIYATASHPGRDGAGTGLIAEMAALGCPVIAIGGVTPERVPELRRAGASGIAAIRGIWDAPSPGEAVRRYLDAWRMA